MNIIAQVFGILALIALCYNYLQTDKKKFLQIQIISNILYGLQYLSLKAMSAFSMSIISIVRTLIFYKYEKDNKKIPIILLIVFELIIMMFGIFSYTTWYSLIPTVVAMIFTIGVWIKDIRVTYIIAILCASSWIYYNLMVGAYIGIICSIIELIAGILGFAKSMQNFKEI